MDMDLHEAQPDNNFTFIHYHHSCTPSLERQLSSVTGSLVAPSAGHQNANRFAALAAESSSDEDYEETSSGETGSDEDLQEVVTHAEVVDILPRKTAPEPATHRAKKKRTGPERSTKTHARSAIQQAMSSRTRKRTAAELNIDKENCSAGAIPTPRLVLTAPTGSGTGSGTSISKPECRKNFIFQFFRPVSTNLACSHGEPGDKHYECCHCVPGEKPKIVTITRRSNGSPTALISYLRSKWPTLFALYEDVRQRQPAKPTAHKIWIARGEISVTEDAVRTHLEGQGLQKKADELAALVEDENFDQSRFEELLAEWIVACDQPFQEVEHSELWRLFQYIHGRATLHIPSADTVKRRIVDLSTATFENVKGMIKASLSFAKL
ncbi:hypothetical protein C8Q80DRAFT_1265415 [Daedaleopsis nitida]|nr:hypothetical protein C8Q80DRAFT_1265415 [Daedaleopsis nitida]